MPLQTQANIFITVLADLLDAERRRQTARLMLQKKVQATRLMKAFRTDLDDGASPSEHQQHGKQMARLAMIPTRDD